MMFVNIEKDLTRIKAISKVREQENWEFRTFLKGECSSKKLDTLVHRLYQEIASIFDCTTCGNCCREIIPILDDEDLARFAQGLGMAPKRFIEQYIVKDNEGFTFHQKPCPFLHDKRCQNYESRPKDCQSYPHLHKDNIMWRLMGVVENYGICPIVFNIYEWLKKEFKSTKRALVME